MKSKKLINNVKGDNTETIPSPKTPPYQRLTQALHKDPKCAQEVALGRRIGLYRFCGDIGRGNFSRVKLAVHQLTKDKVAIKVVDRSRLDSRAFRMLNREISTLECVHHPNILRLFEVVDTLGRVHLVTEWIRGGELYNRITQNGPFKEAQAAPLFKQLLLAVKHMHNLGFVHRDIKAENVLLVTEDRIKLADFGFSTQLNGSQQHLDTFCGSPPYAAPELFSDDHYIGGPVDVWALGVLVYFMIVGNMPFRAPTVPALRAAILKGDYLLPSTLSLPCIRIIQRILIHTPSRRPTIDQLLLSQWIIQYSNVEKHSSSSSDNNSQITNKTKSKKLHWFSRKRNKSASGNSNNNNNNTFNGSNKRHNNIIDLNNIAPLQCNTKRTNSVLDVNFLMPIDNNNNNNNSHNLTIVNDITNNNLHNNHNNTDSINKTHRKSLLFSGTLKKKIGPMEEKEKGKMFNRNSLEMKSLEMINVSGGGGGGGGGGGTGMVVSDAINTTTAAVTVAVEDNKNENHFINNPIILPSTVIVVDDEEADFIMIPTFSGDLTNLHPLESETRLILNNLGVTSEMLCNAISLGPKSDIIGAYRIIIDRLQKQSIIDKQAEIININNIKEEELNRSNKNKRTITHRTCAIL